LLDTGAQCTCLPAAEVEKIADVLDYDRIKCIGPVGPTQDVTAYTVHLRIGDLGADLEDVLVIATARPYALIGRDILNKYKLVLDGPRLVWTHL
jgi:hypothetical protein